MGGSVVEWLVQELKSLTVALKRAERGRQAVMNLSSALLKFRDAKSLCQGLLQELRSLVRAGETLEDLFVRAVRG